MSVALVLSPHPDDELLGCPAHLFALRDAGWQIVNVPLSFGTSPERSDERLAELQAACRSAGFELLEPPADLVGAFESSDEAAAAGIVLRIAGETGAEVLVAPSPHDVHPLHERTGRTAANAFRAGAGTRLWLWALWGELPLVNSVCSFEPRRLNEIDLALKCHAGEVERADLPRLIRARAETESVLLAERAFGFGGSRDVGTLAEGLLELMRSAGSLRMTAPAMFDPSALASGADGAVLDAWLATPSARALSGVQA